VKMVQWAIARKSNGGGNGWCSNSANCQFTHPTMDAAHL